MNIDETKAKEKFCVVDRTERCLGSACMAWRYLYREVPDTSPVQHRRIINKGRCGMVQDTCSHINHKEDFYETSSKPTA